VRVVGNDGGGLVLRDTAYASVRNCFVGGSVNNVAAVAATDSNLALLYSTVGAGFGAAATALSCNGGATVNVRNSLLVSESDSPAVACTTDMFASSLTEAELSDMNTNWFGGYGAGDFSLTGMAPPEILTTAVWNTGDPAVDIDGDDSRPDVAGTADVAGADVP